MPEISIPLALAVAAAGVNYYNTTNTQNKQNNALTNEILDQQAAQKKATGQVASQTKAVAQSNPAAEQEKATQGFIDQLRQNTSQIHAGDPTQVGASNSRYATDANAATTGADTYAHSLASSMAAISGAQRQRQDEQEGFQNTASAVGQTQFDANQQAYADKIRTQSIQQNPWLTLTGKVLQGASMATGAYYGAAGAAADSGSGIAADSAQATNADMASGSNFVNPLVNSTGTSSAASGAWADA